MKVKETGSFYTVTVSEDEVTAFRRSWPGSNLPDAEITFGYDRHGDLVEVTPDDIDGPDILALSQDAKDYAKRVYGL